jgi:hypothetical protein
MRRRLSNTKGSRRANEVFINLQGCEETGVAAPGDYEQVQERIIDALLDWHGPQGNRRAVCFALKKREASMLGYWGSECGDVIFAYNQGFTWGVNPGQDATAMSHATTANHGAGVPTPDTGMASNMGLLLGWGPRARAGVRCESDGAGPIPIYNVGLTVAGLLGRRVPCHATGGTLHDMLP